MSLLNYTHAVYIHFIYCAFNLCVSLFVVVVVVVHSYRSRFKKKFAFFSIQRGYIPSSPAERVKKEHNRKYILKKNLLKRQLEGIM